MGTPYNGDWLPCMLHLGPSLYGIPGAHMGPDYLQSCGGEPRVRPKVGDTVAVPQNGALQWRSVRWAMAVLEDSDPDSEVSHTRPGLHIHRESGVSVKG